MPYKDKAKKREAARKWRAANRDKNRDKKRAYERASYAANPDKRIACVRAWQIANPEKVRAYSRAWKTANPDKVRASARAQSRTQTSRFSSLKGGAKKRGLLVSISIEEYIVLISNPCFYCGGTLPEAGSGVDRIDSSFGYIPGNVRPCCTNCNLAKNDMGETEFNEWLCRSYWNGIIKESK